MKLPHLVLALSCLAGSQALAAEKPNLVSIMTDEKHGDCRRNASYVRETTAFCEKWLDFDFGAVAGNSGKLTRINYTQLQSFVYCDWRLQGAPD